jgi:hypothetical protein
MISRFNRPLKTILFNANGIGRQRHELSKQLQDLRTDVALSSEPHLKPHETIFFLPIITFIELTATRVGKADLQPQLEKAPHTIMQT